jgi:hypothetical protein
LAEPKKLTYILIELKNHAPFTLFGAVLGIIFMLIFKNMLHGETSELLFNIFHPAHVVLSAIATAAMFKLYSKKTSLLTLLLIGYIGSIGVATLSDSIIPHIGETMLGMHVDLHDHADLQDGHHQEALDSLTHQDDLTDGHAHDSDSLHIGFIDNWYIVNPAAIIGVLIAFFWPQTKFPHFGHVLLSIWASLFHVLMAMNTQVSLWQWIGIGLFLFIAVWLPCCISDIVFPLLFVKPGGQLPKHHH